MLAALTVLSVGSWPRVGWLWRTAAWLCKAHNDTGASDIAHLCNNKTTNNNDNQFDGFYLDKY